VEQTLKRNGRAGGAEVRNRYGAILAAAKRFLCRAIDASGNAMPRVMNVDKNPSYAAAVEALKAEGAIPSRVVVLRQCKYLNNVIEQDHRTVKKRVWLAKGYGSVFHRGGAPPLQNLFQNCEITRIPGLRDHVVLLADLAEHGIVDVHEIRKAEFLLR